MINVLLAFVLSFVVGLGLIPLVFWIVDKTKAKQTILQYVTTHKNKQGTRTLGGLIFVFSACLVAPCFFNSQNRLAVVALVVFVSFALYIEYSFVLSLSYNITSLFCLTNKLQAPIPLMPAPKTK